MERLDSERISCVPCDIGWSDVGSWDAVVDLLKSDHQDSVIAVDAKNNFAFSHLEKQYAFVGVDNIVLIDTADATLVTQRGATQKVKTVSDVLRERGSSLADDHVFEARPWGRFEVLKSDNCFKSKIIQVLPQQQLSLQSHARREEHWVVTKGKGEVVINDNTLTVQRGSYVNIPLTAKHRMRNTGTEPLEFVEVQIGDYFGEDDIVRYQDDYQRQ
jgi:mannose-1-phosphate guanylyltransferase/mannose-1-phosphate guanylyltransferase/mannose-6-phosphate isomerase